MIWQFACSKFSTLYINQIISFKFTFGDFWFFFFNINIIKTLEFDTVLLNLFFCFSFKFTLADFWFCSFINSNISKTLEFNVVVRMKYIN